MSDGLKQWAVPLLVPVVAASCMLLSSSLGAQDSLDPLRSALAKRIDEARHGTGAVVGLLTPEGQSFVTYGRVSVGGPEPTAGTIFEIGSITKVFTAFLLADMVERGDVKLDDPVRKHLPASVIVPSYRGKEIALADLATHSAALPRDSVPVDLSRDDNPYVGYTEAQLYAFLGSYRLERNPGSRVDYSNVGVALLGHALSLRAGMSYEDLLRRRLFEPLGMTNTSVGVSAERRANAAVGHNPKLVPVPPWTGGVIVPAGGVNSTAVDMLKFAAAVLDAQSPLKPVFVRMTSVKRPLDDSGQQALGWGMFRRNRNELLHHSGGTFGVESRLVLDTTRKRAVIAWANGRSGEGVSNLVGLALDRARLQ